MKQTRFSKKYIGVRRSVYGGELKVRGAKLARPVATKNDMHLVLKSDKAIGKLSLYAHRAMVNSVIHAKAKKFFVHIKDITNMGNHLHIRLRVLDQKNFGRFLKSITTLIARKITGARRGRKFGRFWQGPAFTRILSSALESMQLNYYFQANRLQFNHGYASRQSYLDRVNRWIQRLKRLDKISI